MTHDQGHESLSEDGRKAVFLALVDLQDHELDVAQSRRLAWSGRLEREGMDRQWHPL
jgi:hypothetical protein